jgi:hypothetical protein
VLGGNRESLPLFTAQDAIAEKKERRGAREPGLYFILFSSVAGAQSCYRPDGKPASHQFEARPPKLARVGATHQRGGGVGCGGGPEVAA